MVKKNKKTGLRKKTKRRSSVSKTVSRKRKVTNKKGKSHKQTDPDASLEASKYKSPIASRKLILKVIRKEGALSYSSLADLLHIKKLENTALRKRLRAMVRDGQLIENRRGGYLPVDKEHLIRGQVIAHPDGFGFLVPEEGGDDLYLHAKQMRTLLHGDKAIVNVSGVDKKGRLEGSVVSVYERANKKIVGRLYIEKSMIFVTPDNKRITQDIFIPNNEVNDAKNGQIVIVEILEQPTFKRQPIGRVQEVIGDHLSPGMEIEMAIHNHNIPYIWPKAVLNDAEKLGESVTKKDTENRKDLRDVPLITIDGEDAMDFDDAVYCEKIGDKWKLLVAIADVSFYVSKDTAIDGEALNRSTSVYFPSKVIPMLPENISNGLCSLKPDVDRLCMVCEMHIENDGNIDKYEFYEAVMNSHKRLTYLEVADIIEKNNYNKNGQEKGIYNNIKELHALYKILEKSKKKRGAIDFETTETKIEFTEDQKIQNIFPVVRNDAHKLIEECMIAANVCAAEFVLKNKKICLFRVHEVPDEDKIEELRGFLDELGLKLGAPGRKIHTKDYSKLLRAIRGRDDYHMIQTLLLRSMRQASYMPKNSGHFGLSLKAYSHFTSPIRRYPDLLLHRVIKHIIYENKYPYNIKTMITLGEHCSKNERRAEEATRDAEFALKCDYMKNKIGEEFSAHVTGVTSFGIFVELDQYYVEGLVHITNLPKDYYQFDPVNHRLSGENKGLNYKLCDQVNVKLIDVSPEDRKIDFILVSENI